MPAIRCVQCERLLIVPIPADAPDAKVALERLVCLPCAWREAAAATAGVRDNSQASDAG